MARTVSSAGAADSKTVKPKPPDDMWERLSEELAVLGISPEPPPRSFQLADFAENLKLNRGQARLRLAQLIKAGKVEKKCRIANSVYFGLVDDGQPKPGPKSGK